MNQLVPLPSRSLTAAGDRARTRYLEFFAAYGRAVGEFLAWCAARTSDWVKPR